MAFITRLHAEHLALKFRTAQDLHWEAVRQERELVEALDAVRSNKASREAHYKFAHEDFARAFAPVLQGEDTDGCRFPHCDSYVLHAPGECRYCDHYPERQAKRVELGVAFTGQAPKEDQIQCPSELLRPAAVIHRWPGNRPTREDD